MQPLAPERSRIGWIGLGRIGAPMAGRVQHAGWPMAWWARRPERAPSAWAALVGPPLATPQELAARCDVVVTVVGGPDDVTPLHDVLMPAARPGTLFLDMSTALPATGERSSRCAATHGMQALDCPVTGGVAGAQRGSLTGFAGGSPEALARAQPLLQAFCQRVVACGAAGSGYRTKLINQTLMVGILMGLADGARLARAHGLDAGWLKATLANATGGSALADSYLERMINGEGPVSFTLGLLQKDLRLARLECEALGLNAPLLDAALAAVGAAMDHHGPDAGIQALAG